MKDEVLTFMKGSILIYGGSHKQREEKANSLLNSVAKEDIMQIEPLEGKKSLGIDQVRNGITFIQKKPFSSEIKVLLLPEADKLTVEAQNALLKTLEEPPSYALIILETNTQESLLPTVLSRCRKISAAKGKMATESRGGEDQKISLQKIKKMSMQAKFDWAQETAKEEKEDVIELLESFIKEERNNIINSKENIKNVRLLLEVKRDLERTNLNTRLALETMALNLG